VTTPVEEAKYWKDQVEGLYHNGLTNTRAIASKWQTTMTAVLGSFVTIAFVWGPDRLKDFPVTNDVLRNGLLVLLCIAGVLGVAATLFAAYAAQGQPDDYQTLTGEKLQVWTQHRASDALSKLRTAQVLGLIAGALVLFVTIWVLFASANKPASATTVSAVVEGRGNVVCGDLTNMNGLIGVKLSDEVTVPLRSIRQLTVVTACPK
jgi:uncharacterized membrane protein